MGYILPGNAARLSVSTNIDPGIAVSHCEIACLVAKMQQVICCHSDRRRHFKVTPVLVTKAASIVQHVIVRECRQVHNAGRQVVMDVVAILMLQINYALLECMRLYCIVEIV